VEQVQQRVRHPLGLEQRVALDPTARADHGIAGADQHGGIRVDRPRAVLQLADEAVVQAVEALLLRLVQREVVGEPAPEADREVAHQGLFDPAEAAHQRRGPAAWNVVAEQEVEPFPLPQALQRRPGGHAAVTSLG
jgi:hypothetical protein